MTISESYPNPVKFWPCFLRQVRIVGGWFNAIFCLPLVISSALDLQQEINADREKDRALFASWNK